MRFSLLIVTVFALASILQADLILIPTDYETIQDGIDASEDGDSLLVLPGEYRENIDYDGKAIVIIGISGPMFTIIDGGGEGPCVSFTSGEGMTSLLLGFTLTGGAAGDNGSGGGIRIEGASPMILFNSIIGNSAGRNGGGVSIVGPQIIPPTLVRNLIADNQAGGTGGAVNITSMPAILLNNTIIGNISGDEGGALHGGMAALGVQVINNIMVGNTSGDGGAVSQVGFGALLSLRYNDVWDNEGGNYNNLQAGVGSISEDPGFIDPDAGVYFLSPDSPCIDTGDPNIPDIDGSRSDIGAFPSIQMPELEPLSVEPDEIDFGRVSVGSDSTVDITLTNPNDLVLQASVLLPLGSPFAVDTMIFEVEAEGEFVVAVTFYPDEEGEFSDSLRIFSLSNVEIELLDSVYTIPWPVGSTSMFLSGIGVGGDHVGKSELLISDFRLLEFYPSPFNSNLMITINLQNPGFVDLAIVNASGSQVETLHTGLLSAGSNRLTWKPQGLSSGVYFLRMQSTNGIETHPVQYLK